MAGRAAGAGAVARGGAQRAEPRLQAGVGELQGPPAGPSLHAVEPFGLERSPPRRLLAVRGVARGGRRHRVGADARAVHPNGLAPEPPGDRDDGRALLACRGVSD